MKHLQKLTVAWYEQHFIYIYSNQDKKNFASHFMTICEIAMCNIYSTLIVPWSE